MQKKQEIFCSGVAWSCLTWYYYSEEEQRNPTLENVGFFYREKTLKGRIVTATDADGNEHRYPSITDATRALNLSMSAIRIHAASGEPIATAPLGIVTLRFDR